MSAYNNQQCPQGSRKQENILKNDNTLDFPFQQWKTLGIGKSPVTQHPTLFKVNV